jgi:hypothetical protein
MKAQGLVPGTRQIQILNSKFYGNFSLSLKIAQKNIGPGRNSHFSFLKKFVLLAISW